MTLSFGIIGFGKMGEIRARSIHAVGAGRIAQIYDPSLSSHEQYDVAPSIEAITSNPSIDAVFVCLPNYLNKRITISALASGKHVFCEKPPAFSAADVEEIILAEKLSGRVLMYGFNHRHHAAVVKMKNLIESGKYGRMLWIRGRYGKSVDSEYLTTWRARKDLAGGGILIDQGIHMLDLFLYLSGDKFDEVQALVSSRYWNIPEVEDNVFALLRSSETGLEVSFHSTMTQWRHIFSLEIFLERGYLVLNGLKTSSNTYGAEELSVARNRTKAPAATWETEEKFRYDVDISWDSEVRHFVDVISGVAKLTFGTSDQALDIMTLVDRIYGHKHRVADMLYDTLQSPR
jgi:predicted dehydrogenase